MIIKLKKAEGNVADEILPIIKVALANIPGGEENLLPAGVWNADLLVEFIQWQNSNPSPGNPELLELYWAK
jgi:hypothetical protein